jgi:hypothetical protein
MAYSTFDKKVVIGACEKTLERIKKSRDEKWERLVAHRTKKMEAFRRKVVAFLFFLPRKVKDELLIVERESVEAYLKGDDMFFSSYSRAYCSYIEQEGVAKRILSLAKSADATVTLSEGDADYIDLMFFRGRGVRDPD